jgi:hypothetical protein
MAQIPFIFLHFSQLIINFARLTFNFTCLTILFSHSTLNLIDLIASLSRIYKNKSDLFILTKFLNF